MPNMIIVLVLALSLAMVCGFAIELTMGVFFNRKIELAERLLSVERNEHMGGQGDDISPVQRAFDQMYKSFLAGFLLLVPNNEEALEKTTIQLQQAGMRMDARTYKASNLFLIVMFSVLFLVLSFMLRLPPLYRLLSPLVGLYTGFLMIRLRITSAIKRRKEEMYHQFPEFLDLLNVSVSAGLGFDQAIGYIIQKSKGALIDELKLVQREIGMGQSRKNALKAFAERCDSLEIFTFVSAIIQADEMGSPLQNVLKIQSETIRESHRQAVEEKAQKMAVKILIPLVLFIFPVMFIVLMGPAAMMIIEAFS